MKPLVSIIVPVYNVEKYLAKCVDSILAQSYENLEIILVDDGSKDSGGAICDDYARKDARIKVFHKQNGGLSSARNHGLDRCHGEYIMFVDSDDFITENAVEVLYQRILQDNSDMAVGQLKKIYDDGTLKNTYATWKNDTLVTGNDALNSLGIKNKEINVCAYAKLYRKYIWQELRYPEHVRVAEDIWVLPHVLEKCRLISISATVVYFYYQRMSGLMNTKDNAALLDDTFTFLHLTRFFLDKNIHLQAQIYFKIGIRAAMKTTSLQLVTKTIRAEFSPEERKILKAGWNWKMKIRWLCMIIPGFHALLRPVFKLVTPSK